ncbi:MAG: FAD-dependent oxidoreductase [Verrucomicrobiota bacterium]
MGGGHAHVEVIRRMTASVHHHLAVTLFSSTSSAPYSGMLPGLIAGHYTHKQTHVDLARLCHWAGIEFRQNAIIGIEPADNRLHLDGMPPEAFDYISLNTGSTPQVDGITGARQYALPVKPVDRFLAQLKKSLAELRGLSSPLRIVVVGGGAGGVELILAVQRRLFLEGERGLGSAKSCEFHLISATDNLLPSFNTKAQQIFMELLRERQIGLHLGHRVTKISSSTIDCANGKILPYNLLLWATSASAPAWLKESGIATTPDGFVEVDDFLRSVSHARIFAAGDIASNPRHPRPKAGVFAVRQGPPLARNLWLAAQGQALERYEPQEDFLSLMSTGDKYAVGTRGQFCLQGRWVWSLKDWIDRRWMRRYQKLGR